MKTLTFNNSKQAEMFQDCTKIEAKRKEDLEDGRVILAFDEMSEKQPEVSKEDMAYEIFANVMKYLEHEVSFVHDRINRLGKELSEHYDGHLPKAKTPSQMESALKGLGWTEDYEVKKHILRAGNDDYAMEARLY